MNLALISGIAGILGLVLQITDAFPEHRTVRQAIVLVVLGFFIGALVSTIIQAQIYVIGGVAASHALIATLIVISSLLLGVAAFTTDATRRGELYIASAIAGGTTFAVFFLVAAAWALSGPRPGDLTFEEYLLLSGDSQRRGNIERAISLTEQAEVFLDAADPRREALERRVLQLKALQVAATKAK